MRLMCWFGLHKWKNRCRCSECGKLRLPLPDVTSNMINCDLFELLEGMPLANNIRAMFGINRSVVGGEINIVDIEFENGVELRNVSISDERMVSIPAVCRDMPILNVGLPNLQRQRQQERMFARC